MWNFPLAPEEASEFAGRYDLMFGVITALTIFFTVVVMALVIFFAIRYRVGSKADRTRPQHENLRIEIGWSLPPLLLGILIFAWGSKEFIDLRRPPKNAIEIFVMGKQWMWHIQHPNGVREMNELHVPTGVPVKLTMISQDVLHEFFIPEFRLQYEVIPGRYTYQWFTATRPGKYYLFCNQYCGTQHSEMGGYVYVLSPADYASWLAHGGSQPKTAHESWEQAGSELYAQLNCANCHTSTDTERAPSLNGLLGKTRRMDNGQTFVANDDYIRESIVDPYAHIVAGYTNTMPADYKKQLTEEQIHSLVAYVKSLGSLSAPATNNAISTPMPRNGT